MKNSIFLISIIALITIPIASAGVLDYPSGLISYWKLDNSIGPVVDSTDGNNGTNNGSTRGNTGIDGNAFSFNGSGNHVEVPDSSNLDFGTTQDFTVSLWFNTDVVDNSYHTLVAKGTYNPTNDWFRLILFNDNKVRCDYQDVGTWLFSEWDMPPSPGAWHHMVCVYDRDGNMSLYINGVLKDSDDISYISPDLTNSEELYFGQRWNGFSYSLYWDGLIDDIAIWNRTLSANEIQNLYNSYEESGVIPEVNNKTLQILIIIVVALLIGALFLKKK